MSGRWGALALVAIVISGCSSDPASPAVEGSATPSVTASFPTPSPSDQSAEKFAAARSALRAATVELVHRASPFGTWRQECTGTTVTIRQKVYVLTARHCISDYFASRSVFPSYYNGSDRFDARDLHTAIDVSDKVSGEFGIRVARGDEVSTSSTAVVRRVVVQYYPDVALLAVNFSGLGGVPALDYEPEVALGLTGSPTLALGFPAAASGKLVEERGSYLGRVQNPRDPTQLLDLVGVHPSGPGTDACNYGASGSIAVISPGYFTGPLALRNNVVNKAGSNGKDDPDPDLKSRRGMAEELGVGLGAYPTICGYGELTREVLRGLVARVDASSGS